jgi:hypothetical protein
MPAEETGGALRLRAEDADDLAVISACMQDALVAVCDITYMPEQESLVFVANRFRWEADEDAATGMSGGAQGSGRERQRTLCVVAFDAVKGVLHRGFRRGERRRILSLLAIRPEFAGDRGGGTIDLEFSGGARIRLETDRILCRLKDVGLPWPTLWRPAHDLGER